jgi:hypothetical protein
MAKGMEAALMVDGIESALKVRELKLQQCPTWVGHYVYLIKQDK